MTYQLITQSQQLAEFCQQASRVQAIAVDTEFVRTRTLYPQLGLIQIYDGTDLVLVDTLAVSDMSPLIALLSNPDVLKVMHACSEDMEAFISQLQVVPSPVFDSQFAACLLGLGNNLGYAALVEKQLGVQLDKGESRTDWLARPLREQQLVYAANDVDYLLQLYPELARQCQAKGCFDWVLQDSAQLAVKKQHSLPPEFAYLAIKNNWKLQGRNLYALKLLASWRLQMARSKDAALNFVVREQNLVEVAMRLPDQKGGLYAISSMTPIEIRKHGQKLLELVQQAKQAPVECYPPRVLRLVDFATYKKVSSRIREHCLALAGQYTIPVEILASKKQVGQLLKWLWLDQDETRASGLLPDLLVSWRGSLLISDLSNLLSIDINAKIQAQSTPVSE